jgi:dTMP kinase
MQKKDKEQGYFIVFEGIDGSGSSTQAELLCEYFKAKKQPAILSPEPSSGKIGKLLREFLGNENNFANQDLFDQQMAYLFAADRHYHLYNNIDGVKKLIKKNIHVITTRYYFSSLAYNSKNKTEYEFVKSLNQQFPPPDLLIYFDIPVDIALERIKDRAIQEIYETKEKLIQVRQNFLQIIDEYQNNYLKIDATKTKEEIHLQIINYLENKQ